MAYKRITAMDIWEIIRRWHDKQSIRHIAKVSGYDWKTVKKFIHYAQEHGLDVEQPLPPKKDVLYLFQNAAVGHPRPRPAQEILQPFLCEISELINDKHHSLRPKIAFEVICQRHDLDGQVSYSSFKRFVRKNNLALSPQKVTCHIEVEAGQEIQVDYTKSDFCMIR